jgi:hypothetical protein
LASRSLISGLLLVTVALRHSIWSLGCPPSADLFATLTGTYPFVRIGIAVGALAVVLIPSAPRAAPAKDATPVFTPISNSAWQANFWDYILPPPQGAGHGPIRTDPAHPYNSQIQNGALFRGGELNDPIVDAKDRC